MTLETAAQVVQSADRREYDELGSDEVFRCRPQMDEHKRIGIVETLTGLSLPHHLTCGSAYGGSVD